MTRKKLSDELVADVLFKSDRECVVCNARGDHIHHVDGNPENNKFENLAFLCFNCHNEASVTGSLRKKLTPKTIVKYRDLKYEIVTNNRKNVLKLFDSQMNTLTSESLLVASKNALIIIELSKLKEAFFSNEEKNQAQLLAQFHKFSEHTNYRLAIDVFEFLGMISDQARNGMDKETASSIFFLILDFFPISFEESDREKVVELSNLCTRMAFSLAYDDAIYLKNYHVMMYGLSILKFVYKKGKKRKITELIGSVEQTYSELEGILKSRDDSSLLSAIQLIKEFKSDLEVGDLSFPPLSNNLMRLVSHSQRSTN